MFMGAPKVFVSSTCYDLAVIRTELRSFIDTYGFEPVMSEYSDFLFDYREHIHSSCLEEIPYCDMVILIIGGRYGAKSVPQALDRMDIERLKEKGLSKELLMDKESLSITQLELLQSIYHDIPIFPFVSSNVMNEYFTWNMNRENDIFDKIIFPSIERQETAKYIFEFIDFIYYLHKGNNITTFSKLDEIKNHLRKQWAALFQRLLREQRIKDQANIELNQLSKQIANLETAVFTSISDTDIREIARGINKYRDLIDFLHLIYRGSSNLGEVQKEDVDWAKLMETFHIDAIVNMSNYQDKKLRGTILILEDGTYFQTRYEYREIAEFMEKWSEFQTLKKSLKLAIVNAILDDIKGKINLTYMVYYPDNYLGNLSLESIDEGTRVLTAFWQSEKFIEKSQHIKGINFLYIADMSQNTESVSFHRLVQVILTGLGIKIFIPHTDYGVDILAYKGDKKVVPIEVRYHRNILRSENMAKKMVQVMKKTMVNYETDESILVISPGVSDDIMKFIENFYSETGVHIVSGNNEKVLVSQFKDIFGLV